MAKNRLLGAKAESPKVIAAQPRMSKDMMDQERRYKAREAMDTLARAEEYRRDKYLMRDVEALARNTMNAVCAPRKK